MKLFELGRWFLLFYVFLYLARHYTNCGLKMSFTKFWLVVKVWSWRFLQQRIGVSVVIITDLNWLISWPSKPGLVCPKPVVVCFTPLGSNTIYWDFLYKGEIEHYRSSTRKTNNTQNCHSSHTEPHRWFRRNWVAAVSDRLLRKGLQPVVECEHALALHTEARRDFTLSLVHLTAGLTW